MKPNILWIYCDELRTDALGCYGNPHAEMQTPHVDALAQRGVRFDNCFCNSPVCVASRTSVLTGRYPEQTGVYHNEAVWPHYRFGEQFDEPPLTFPALFAQHGYRTANFGKVHVPASLDVWQHSDTGGAGMGEFYEEVDAASLQIIRPPGVPTAVGGTYPGDRPYPPARVADNALRWLSKIEGADKPFLARVSLLQPHTPVFPPPPFDALYRHAPFPDSVERPCALSQFEARFAEIIRADEMSAEEIFLAHVYYYGLVAWIDSQVGRLLDFLRTRGQLEQTIVIFDADHGASLGECGRFQKQTFAPESQRVPRIISWPGTLPSAQARADICESLDLARTLCALADVPVDAQFEGRDLFHDPPPAAVYSTIGYGFASSRAFPNLGVGEYTNGRGWPRRACIRTERYRLDKNVRIDGAPVAAAEEDIFLADVRVDPAEKRNIADDAAHANVLTRLSLMLDHHGASAVEVPQAWTRRDETPT